MLPCIIVLHNSFSAAAFFLLILFTDGSSLEIHDRIRRNGAPTNYWWIPGVPSSPSSTEIHKVTCGDPGKPVFGSSLFESVNAGAIVIHTCNPGHRLDGAKLRLCQSNGQWTPQLPTCACECLHCNSLLYQIYSSYLLNLYLDVDSVLFFSILDY